MPSIAPLHRALLAALLIAPSAASAANTLAVTLKVEDAVDGEVGCALYASDAGFPSDDAKAAVRQWHPAAAEVVCTFTDLPDGLYAVAASHDRNGNRRVDTNLVGMPKEAWGVTRDARPTFRAPRFSEAAIALEGGGTTTAVIEVRR